MSKKEKKEQPDRKSPKKVWKIIVTVLLATLLAVLLAVGVLLLIPAFEQVSASAENDVDYGGTDWMAKLPDDRKLSEIRIPGVHDAATEYVELAFVTRCQGKSIGDLLTDGFRYLDMRLAVEKKTKGEGTDLRLRFMHGPMKCKTGFWPWESNLYLENVLEDCYAFLDAHPGETIIFVAKQEVRSEGVEEFQWILKNYVDQHKDKWLLKDDGIPTLGEARGKIVLFRRYVDAAGFGADAGLPLIWTDQGNKDHVERNYVYEDNGLFKLAVQDRYKYANDDKWTAFTAEPTKEREVTLSFLSTAGNWIVGHPYAYASDLNPRLLALTKEELPEGWIVVDFGNAELAHHIFSAN